MNDTVTELLPALCTIALLAVPGAVLWIDALATCVGRVLGPMWV